jgi:hypothetical protein
MSKYSNKNTLASFTLVALFAAACSSEPQKPAVDAKLLESRLNQMVDALVKSENPDLKVTAAGPAKVETKEDGTVIGSTPVLTVKEANGGTVTVEPFVLTFKRGDNDDTIPFDLKIPSSISPKDATGKASAEIKIGAQKIEGVWRDDLQTVDKMNFKINDVVVEPKDQQGKMTLSELTMTGGIEDKSGGLYDAKYSGRMAGFALDDPTNKTVMRMGEVGFRGNMYGAKLKEYGKAAKEAGYTLSNPEVFKMWTSGKLDDKTLAFLKRMPEFLGSIDYGYNVKDISMTENGKPMFALAKADFGFGLKPESAEKATANVNMAFGGFSAEGEDGKPVIPPEADVKDSKLDIDIAGLPSKELWGIYMSILPQIQQASLAEAAGASSPAAEAAMTKASEEAMMKFTQALSTANLGVNLKTASVTTPTIVMGGDGAATYNMAASPMPVGKFTFRFSGVEALQEAMQKRGKDDEMAQQVLGGIMGLKAMAKPDPKAPAGKVGYLIEVEFTKDGKVLANGQQMM